MVSSPGSSLIIVFCGSIIICLHSARQAGVTEFLCQLIYYVPLQNVFCVNVLLWINLR